MKLLLLAGFAPSLAAVILLNLCWSSLWISRPQTSRKDLILQHCGKPRLMKKKKDKSIQSHYLWQPPAHCLLTSISLTAWSWVEEAFSQQIYLHSEAWSRNLSISLNHGTGTSSLWLVCRLTFPILWPLEAGFQLTAPIIAMAHCATVASALTPFLQ